MDDKGAITIIASTVITAKFALAADGTSLVALDAGQPENAEKKERRRRRRRRRLTPFLRRRQVLQPLLFPGTPTMTDHVHTRNGCVPGVKVRRRGGKWKEKEEMVTPA